MTKKRRSNDLTITMGSDDDESMDFGNDELVVYGDSITWGMGHEEPGRYKQSWPRRLTSRFAAMGIRVIEEGLCGRTTVLNDPRNVDWMPHAEPHFFNGLHHLGTCLHSHSPQWLIIALGTNDLKTHLRSPDESAQTIAARAAFLAQRARMYFKNIHIVLLSPPRVVLTELSEEMGYDQSSADISAGFAKAYAEECSRNNLLHVHADLDMEESIDGVHPTEEHGEQIAEAVWAVIGPYINRNLRPRTGKS